MISLLHGKEWAIKLDKKYFLICYLKDKYKVIIVFCGLIVCNVFMYFLKQGSLFGASRAYNNHLFLRLFFAGLPVHSAMFAKSL